MFICCSRVEINEFSSLGFSQELKIIHKVFGTMFFQKIQRSTNDLRYYCGTFRIRVNSLYFFTPYISSYSVFLIFVTKIIYYCSKDNILLHGEIQILVLSHRKQIAKYWICVWHFLKDYPNVFRDDLFCLGWVNFLVWDIALWQPPAFEWHFLISLFVDSGFCFVFVCSSICRIIQFTDQNCR